MTNTLDKTVLLLVSMAPLLVPFGLVRNVSLQAMLVCLTGALAWLSVAINNRATLWQFSWLKLLLFIYLLTCAVSTLFNPSLFNLFGTPLIRLGALELVACVGIGLCLRAVPNRILARYLYISIALLALASIPYSLLHHQDWNRIGGLFYQPDFLAVVLGVGFIIGISLWPQRRIYRLGLVIAQAYILGVILLTQTRAVVGILFVFILALLWFSKYALLKKSLLTAAVFIVAIGGLALVSPLDGRLQDASFAVASTKYRLALQGEGVQQLTDRPLTGYGIGDLRTPLVCSDISAPILLKTCSDGYYFTSTHNVFLDRFLALGWIGGLSFTVLVLSLLWKGLHRANALPFGLCALLIALYYLTNIASLQIELLLWICLLRINLK